MLVIDSVCGCGCMTVQPVPGLTDIAWQCTSL